MQISPLVYVQCLMIAVIAGCVLSVVMATPHALPVGW